MVNGRDCYGERFMLFDSVEQMIAYKQYMMRTRSLSYVSRASSVWTQKTRVSIATFDGDETRKQMIERLLMLQRQLSALMPEDIEIPELTSECSRSETSTPRASKQIYSVGQKGQIINPEIIATSHLCRSL